MSTKSSPSSRGKTHFPNIGRIAAKLGAHRITVYRALKGANARTDLARAYLSAALPGLLSRISLAALPAGTRIEIPSDAERMTIAAALGANARAEGAALILLSSFALIPPEQPA